MERLTISVLEKAIDQLSRYYQKRMSNRDVQVVAEMWLEDLDGSMNESTFNEAVNYYRKEYNRMPRPADLIRISRDAGHQSQASDKVVLDGITGRLKWHDDPDGTEYISLKEFKRRNPGYAKKLEGLGTRFGNLLKSLPDHVIYDDRNQESNSF